jgi:hypothetical protein
MSSQPNLFSRVGTFLTTWAGFLTSLGVIITAAIGTYNVVIRPRDVAVYINKQDVIFPSAINTRAIRVFNFMMDSCHNRSLDSDAYYTLRYLQSTNNYWVITLRNQTKSSVKGVVLKVSGVTALASAAVTGDYLNDSETNALTRNVHFDSASKVIYLADISTLHPKADLKLYLWGKMDDLSLWNNVSVSYEGGDASAGEEYTVTGFKALLCEYLYSILIFIAAVFGFFYWRMSKRTPPLNNPPNSMSGAPGSNPPNPNPPINVAP